MTPQQIINNSYIQLQRQGIGSFQSAQIYYSIVNIKFNEGMTDIYLDIKNFIKNYIVALDEQNYNYDKLDKQKILDLVNLLVIDQKIAMMDFLRKMFIRHQCDDDWKLFESEYYTAKVMLIKLKWYYWINPFTILKLVYFKFCYSNTALVLTLGVFVIIDILLLIPNPWNLWPSLFKVQYQAISDSFYLNHVMNVLMGIFEFSTDFKVLPMNLLALLILIFGKSLKILVVVGYIIDKIIKRINFND